MKRIRISFSILFFIVTISIFGQNRLIQHDLSVYIEPELSLIEVSDIINAESISGNRVIIRLNSSLDIYHHSSNIKLKKLGDIKSSKDIGMDRDDVDSKSDLKLTNWEVSFKESAKHFTIKYKGKIKSALKQSNTNYQRGFSESPGIISKTGIYLAGSTYWIPTIENSLITYSLETSLPKGWKTVSQGKRIMPNMWVCKNPQEEIFLIGAKFTEYTHKMNNGTTAMAFLRTPDEGIANKYLEVTEQYMSMYESLIGKFPYSKFALVENFWETGYGMPSFTLLGEKIIRFPFILHSSYPHELLHNWWGNSVYVDFDKGNWCEGITAYLADHLIKEQRGQGNNYRRSTLQKFTDFVDDNNDFPLSKFISRHDGSSEAIGYGKSLMMFHMLRNKLGDKNFIAGLREFYNSYKYKTSSFDDIRLSMEKVSGIDLKDFFKQWIYRKGAPKLELISSKVSKKDNKPQVLIILEQKQKEKAFSISVPIYILTDKGLQKEIFEMNKKKQGEYFEINGNIQKISIDPFYDVFRLLDPKEVPPALSKVLASKKNVIILPMKVSDESNIVYADFAQKWIENDNDEYTIVFDSDIEELPKDKTAWIVGFENKFAKVVNKQLSDYNSGFKGDTLTVGSKKVSINNKDFAITTFAPNDFNSQIVFISIGKKESIDGFVRKLPHYGKYSYLGFEGDEPTNIAKGQWQVLDSPLEKEFVETESIKEERKALAYLKPLFSEERMMNHINYLASEELKGRGLGTPEIDDAAEYIAKRFKEYGLKPIDDTYYQEFKHKFKVKGKLNLKNVIGIIPGTDPDLKESPIVISAHYDHLGLGWPDVHSGDEGKIHFGADDNASGVAILLELAKSTGKTLKPKRTVIFAAFTGEEAGLVGSRYFINNFKSDFLNLPFANINIDTDGRLFDKKLLVLNANTAREWKFIFMGTDYTTGVKTQVIEKELDSSDQFAFIEKGIPAIQLFTGAHTDYHRPTDTKDKIDAAGMVKVTTVAKEVLVYLADRTDAMNFTGKTSEVRKEKPKSAKNRRVSTGSIPDFAFSGIGVKIASVIPNSVGEKAGLLANDIIKKLNDVDILTLKQYSNELKKYKPGDIVTLLIDRNSEKIKIELVLGAR